MDYGVQFNKLFYERLISGGNITLFSPIDVQDCMMPFLQTQDKFKELYETAERKTSILKSPFLQVFYLQVLWKNVKTQEEYIYKT